MNLPELTIPELEASSASLLAVLDETYPPSTPKDERAHDLIRKELRAIAREIHTRKASA
jgi:hypothetical protein